MRSWNTRLLVRGLEDRVTPAISITGFGPRPTETFSTLAISGTSSTLPAGWAFSESGIEANNTYSANDGGSAIGDTFSLGTDADRAFGGLRSGNLIPTIGVAFANNTGAVISRLGIVYTGEQWRLGALDRVDRLDFQYSLDATSLTSGTWIDVSALDFTAPVTGPTVGPINEPVR